MGDFIQWHVVAVCICCALFVTSHFDVIFMFPNQRCGIFFYTHSPYFVCHCTEYKLSVHQGSKTHSSLRQNKLQLQNQAALMSRQIRAVEHRCAAGLVSTHPGLQDRILLNYTRIENAHRVRKKTFIFLLCIEVQQTFSFPFSLLKHYQIPECFYVNNCYFELVQLFYHATEIGNVVNAVSACGEQPIVVWDIMNYCGTQISKTRSGRKVCKKW